MAEVILMPRLSDTMTEGVIAAWHKKVGEPVKKGDLLAEVETDKATMELESYKDGILLHVGVDKGGKLQVNDLLAVIGNPGEDISSLLKPGSASTPSPAKPAPVASTAPANSTSPAMDISKIEEVILMPRLSDTMTEGVIAAWHKKVGDSVKKGDLLADVETDKATMELESYKNGKLLYIGAQKGDKVPVNALLCIIGEEGKVDVNALVAAAKNPTTATEAVVEGSVAVSVAAPAATASNAATRSTNDDNGRVKAWLPFMARAMEGVLLKLISIIFNPVPLHPCRLQKQVLPLPFPAHRLLPARLVSRKYRYRKCGK
jgi:pyruvate dehydrogenase E2 component (dihydrolipoamide acetyltransferase)